jgi:hypothetical protein
LIFKLINADIETSITTVALGKYSSITTVCLSHSGQQDQIQSQGLYHHPENSQNVPGLEKTSAKV